MADNSINNGIVRYSSRDYQSIFNDFMSAIPTLTELWDGESDSDPGIVIAKYIAACADMLGINLDLQANEVYAPTVSQRKNAEKIFALFGYDLGFYTAARTEVTFTNATTEPMELDFGFNGANFSTLNAYTDITNAERVITYNILPMTTGFNQSRSSRYITTSDIDVFVEEDPVVLKAGESCTRVAVEGELRSFNVSVADVKANNYIITLPSQHVDTTAVWLKAKGNLSDENFLVTRWRQVSSVAEFVTPEPLFAVSYDNYSNAQITVSNYLNQLENYSNNYLIVYWMDCSGVIGCVGEDVLTNLIWAKSGEGNGVNSVSSDSGDLTISNLSNTVELPNTFTVTGQSPETAREAYLNSRNYINTWDSLITLPDFNKFISREPGVDTGLVIDCQKALEYNMTVYNDTTLTDAQKSKMYITNADFPAGPDDFDWTAVLNLGFDPSDPQKFVFSTNFKRYTAMTFAIHNNFQNSSFGNGQVSTAYTKNTSNFIRYKPPAQFISYVEKDYEPLGAMSVDLEFGYTRLFNFTVIGQIYTVQPVSKDVAATLLNKVKETLSLFFAPGNREYGQLPTLMEIVNVINNADDRISYFDAGNTQVHAIEWINCDIDYFNLISFARYIPDVANTDTLIISPSCIVN